MKLRMAAVLVVATAVIVSAGQKTDCGQKAACCKEDGHHAMWKELGLTETQRASLKTLREDQMTGLKEIAGKMREVRLTVKNELLKDNPGDAVLDRAAKDAGDLAEAMTTSFIDHLLEVKKVLTPEQFAKVMVMEHGNFPGMGSMQWTKPGQSCDKPCDKPGDAGGKDQKCCPKKKAGGGCPMRKDGGGE